MGRIRTLNGTYAPWIKERRKKVADLIKISTLAPQNNAI